LPEDLIKLQGQLAITSHQATSILGDNTTFSKVASQMNLLSMVDKQPTVSLNKWILLRCLKQHTEKRKTSSV
jgi:hypothetical protein